jgi:hypothetical protein
MSRQPEIGDVGLSDTSNYQDLSRQCPLVRERARRLSDTLVMSRVIAGHVNLAGLASDWDKKSRTALTSHRDTGDGVRPLSSSTNY